MSRTLPETVGAVAELQGLYGPFSFSEKLLQKIWLKGDFDRSRIVDTTGARVRVLHPGRWNLLGGPDFKDARLRFDDGGEVIGDVELHLRATDWEAHAHVRDPAYDRVVLHVVLFPPAAGYVTRGADGRAIPVVALLPWLHHDLEEYAAEEVVETLANRPAARILEVLGPLTPAVRAALLQDHAEQRWRQKVRFARLRIERLGWDEACHQTALEILGYRFNRAPMLRIAGAQPLAAWRASEFSSEAVFETERGGWSLQGLRPANHPRRRLQQYAEWVSRRPTWPDTLRVARKWIQRAEPEWGAAEARRRLRLGELRERLREEIGAGAVGGTRFENLVCDGFWPLLAAGGADDLQPYWRHWFVGDVPPVLAKALRELGVFDGRLQPACHGAVQGLLGWLIAQETQRAVTPGRGA